MPMSDQNKKVVIIGAGFAGLSAACTLAAEGMDVTILEKLDQAGGRARTLEEEGYLFDMGPSWYWLPDVFEEFFAGFGKKPSDYYRLERLDPSYRVFYGKNDFLDLPASAQGVIDLFEKEEPGAGAKLKKYLNEAAFKYHLGIGELVRKPADSWLEYMNWKVISGSLRLNVFQSFHAYVRRNFKNPRLFPILEFPVIFLGATPKKTPALYSLMNYADIALGTWYPMGGMSEVVKAMVKLAKELGVKVILNEEVVKVEAENARVKAVHTHQAVYPATYVIGAGDYHHIEQKLLPAAFRRYNEKYWDSRDMAPSSLLYYLGISKPLPALLHHNLLFDEDFGQHAKDLFDKPVWPEKPLLYISCTSKTDPAVAPAGLENLVVLIPVAPGLHDSQEVRDKYYEYILKKLSEVAGEDIRNHVAFRRDYSQEHFAADYNAYKGNAYGLGNTLLQTAVLKPRMRSKLGNFWFAGQMTSPGPGVPPSIISGQVAAKQILKAWRKP